MLSPRNKALVPQIVERLNRSKEGRIAARDRRSTAALRRLDEEIRLLQKEIKKRRGDKSPRLRFLEVRRRLLDTEVNVEEIGFLAGDPDGRVGADAEDWRGLAERLQELSENAQRVASEILNRLDVVDADSWEAPDQWTLKELSGADDDVVDAEVVDED